MTAPYTKASKEIARFVKGLMPNSTTQQIDSVHFQVVDGSSKAITTFGNAELQDFESALTSTTMPHPYVEYVTRGIHMRIYIWLGRAGMVPHIKMSTVLLQNSPGYHPRGVQLLTDFRPNTAENLYRRLKVLEQSLAITEQAARSEDVPVPEIESELKHLRTLTSFYEDRQSLTSKAEWDSLSLLKAAALLWVMDLESKKSASASARIRAGYDKKIYSIIQEFQSTPWDRIPFPPALQEHVDRGETSRLKISRETLFDIDALLAKLDPRLVQRRAGAWAVLNSGSQDSVSQAANSMVELLNHAVDLFCNGRALKDVLDDKYPQLEKLNVATRSWIAAVKESLHAVKHQTKEQPVHVAEDLMHAAELIIRSLLR